MLPHDLRRTSRLALVGLAARRRWGWLLGAAVMLAFGGLFVVVPWGMLARDAAVDAVGARGQGEIQILTTDWDEDRGTDYILKYTILLPSGGAVWGRGSASRDDWRALAVGDAIAVHYDPRDPYTNFPADARYSLGRVRTPGYAAILWLCGLLFVMGGGLVAWGLLVRLPGTWHRLLAHGQSAGGRVLAREQQTDSDGDATPAWRLRYAFPDRFGATREGATECGPKSLFDGWTPGDAGEVRYDARDPQTSVWLGRGDLAFYR